MRPIPLSVLMLCVLIPRVHAGEVEEVSGGDALVRAVQASPLSLGEAMQIAYGGDRQPISAAFLLDASDQLLLRAILRVVDGAETAFEEWVGPVHAAGWIPHRRALEGPSALARAERRWRGAKDNPQLMRRAVKGAVGAQEPPAATDVALAVQIELHAGEARALLRVGKNGMVRGLVFDPEAATYSRVDPGPSPERAAFEAPSLPPLDVADAVWFNVEGEPTLEAWRGSPVLVVITDPG